MNQNNQAPGSSVETDWNSLKTMAGEWFRALNDNPPIESIDNGFKCLMLGYFGLTCTDAERHQAEVLMRLACRRMLDINIHEDDKRARLLQFQGRLNREPALA